MDVYSVTLTIAATKRQIHQTFRFVGASLSLLFIGREPVKLCNINGLCQENPNSIGSRK